MYCLSPNRCRPANPRLVRGRIVYKSKRTISHLDSQRSQENLLATVVDVDVALGDGDGVNGGTDHRGSKPLSATSKAVLRYLDYGPFSPSSSPVRASKLKCQKKGLFVAVAVVSDDVVVVAVAVAVAHVIIIVIIINFVAAVEIFK
uniref:Transmembrane protein n=1 Tax=Angiostrongylus cantonensis TaxID=6313 RepID=A0A0K0D0B7_ANGCA